MNIILGSVFPMLQLNVFDICNTNQYTTLIIKPAAQTRQTYFEP